MRSSPLIEYSSTVLLLCLWLGAITTVFSSLIGLFQQDIKKVIAYSTMSQLARKYFWIKFMFYLQTICVENILSRIWWRSREKDINSQVTKAHDYSNNNHISNKGFNSDLWRDIEEYFYILSFISSISEERKRKPITKSRWVGTPEAIRLVLIYFFLYLIIFINFFYIILILHLALPGLSYSGIKFTILILLCAPVLLWTFINKVIEEWYSTPYSLVNKARRGLRTDIFTRNGKLKVGWNSSIFPSPLAQRRYCSRESGGRDPFFFEWLAGVIDGNGHFCFLGKEFSKFNLVMDIRDKKALYDIKHKLGGSIRRISNGNALKYELIHQKGLIDLLKGVNGLIRNPTRMLEMNKFCKMYEIDYLYPNSLRYYDGWLSGFIDSKGSVYFDETSGQVFIVIAHKNKYLLDPLINLYGGKIKIDSSNFEVYKYVLFKKNDLFQLIDNYFSKYPLKTKKLSRINLIKEFYSKWNSRKNSAELSKLYEWVEFKDKWEKYQD